MGNAGRPLHENSKLLKGCLLLGRSAPYKSAELHLLHQDWRMLLHNRRWRQLDTSMKVLLQSNRYEIKLSQSSLEFVDDMPET